MINEDVKNNSSQKTTFIRGTRVAVKTYGGKVVERLVWDYAAGVCFVCTDDIYAALQDGNEAPTPTGFPIEDVVLLGDSGFCATAT